MHSYSPSFRFAQAIGPSDNASLPTRSTAMLPRVGPLF